MKIITFDLTNTLIKVVGVSQQYNKILMLNKINKIKLNDDLTNKIFGRLFKQQNIKHPGYGYSQGMSSRTWWSTITREIIQENTNHQGVSFHEDEIDIATNLIFDEFCDQKYWQHFENCGKYKIFRISLKRIRTILIYIKSIFKIDQILKQLKKENYRLGIISNFDERIYKILVSMQLLEYFDFIKIPSNSYGHAKPNPEIFLQTIKLAEKKYGTTKKNQFLHIGDNIELDYKAARICGFKSILMCHDNSSNKILKNLKCNDELKNPENYALNLIDLKEKILYNFNES